MLGNQRQYQVDVAGSLGRFRDGLDRSIAMSTIRGLTGRPLALADPRPFPPALSSEEIAYRIRLPGATARPLVRAVEEVDDSELALAAADDEPIEPIEPIDLDVSPVAGAHLELIRQQAVARSDAGHAVVRTRLLRDATAMITGLAGIAVLVAAVWPMTAGGVLDATGTPGPGLAVAVPAATEHMPDATTLRPSPAPGAPTGSPILPAVVLPSEEPASSATPGEGTISSPGRGPARTSDPAPRATQPAVDPDPATPPPPVPPPPSSNPDTPPPVDGPPATPDPGVVPEPIWTPPPMPDPDPTPDPTPTPTPEPTPIPTPMPDPTPEPTPDPTPEPTPDPTPEPTPETPADL